MPSQEGFGFTGFRKHDKNPVLAPQGHGWESKAVFNPAAWTDGVTVFLLYRAQGLPDSPREPATSRIGLALSTDGTVFHRAPEPILEPTEVFELHGGCEDPRVVAIDGTFYMTYTAFDGRIARSAMATSKDLRHWKKRGLVFSDVQLESIFSHPKQPSVTPPAWSKSGAILSQQIGGKYWMYFGDTNIWVAHSRDLIRWDIIGKPVLSPRNGLFDSRLVEPGPPPLIRNGRIWLGYNAADDRMRYTFGQALFDLNDPTTVISRSSSPLLQPTTFDEFHGQVDDVVFGEGIVYFRGRYLLYYGMADTRIGVAIAQGDLR